MGSLRAVHAYNDDLQENYQSAPVPKNDSKNPSSSNYNTSPNPKNTFGKQSASSYPTGSRDVPSNNNPNNHNNRANPKNTFGKNRSTNNNNNNNSTVLEENYNTIPAVINNPRMKEPDAPHESYNNIDLVQKNANTP